MNTVTASQTLIGSLHKSFDLASLNGNLKLKNLYLLNLINKYIYGCGSAITFNQKQYLLNLAIAIENLDKNICRYREQRSLYTNIVGCKNCKNVNQSDYVVINTPPEINDDVIITPACLYPTIKFTTLNYLCGMVGIKVTLQNFTSDSSFNFLGSAVAYKNLKITSLPISGALTYNGIPIVLNQIIDLQDFDAMNYTQLSSSETNKDSFTFQVSSTEYPDCYSKDGYIELNICDLDEEIGGIDPVDDSIYDNNYNEKYL